MEHQLQQIELVQHQQSLQVEGERMLLQKVVVVVVHKELLKVAHKEMRLVVVDNKELAVVGIDLDLGLGMEKDCRAEESNNKGLQGEMMKSCVCGCVSSFAVVVVVVFQGMTFTSNWVCTTFKPLK